MGMRGILPKGVDIANDNRPGKSSALWLEISPGEPSHELGRGGDFLLFLGPWAGLAWSLKWGPSQRTPGVTNIVPCRVRPGPGRSREMDQKGKLEEGSELVSSWEAIFGYFSSSLF